MALTRGVSPALLSALGGVFHPVVLVHLDWPGGAIYAHSGTGTIVHESQNWLGVGSFGGIEVPAEAGGLAATRAKLVLHGVPATAFGYLDDPIRNRPGRVLVGAVTERAGSVLIGAPFEVYAGPMDALRLPVAVREGPSGTMLAYSVELELGSGPSARAAAAFEHTPEDQAAKFPGDSAGRHVLLAVPRAKKLRWPAT